MSFYKKYITILCLTLISIGFSAIPESVCSNDRYCKVDSFNSFYKIYNELPVYSNGTRLISGQISGWPSQKVGNPIERVSSGVVYDMYSFQCLIADIKSFDDGFGNTNYKVWYKDCDYKNNFKDTVYGVTSVLDGICGTYVNWVCSVFDYGDNSFEKYSMSYPVTGNSYTQIGSNVYWDFKKKKENIKVFTKNEIEYAIIEWYAFSCNVDNIYSVSTSKSKFYVTKYKDCDYNTVVARDTNLVENEFQKESVAGNWVLFRKNGTKKFEGRLNGGYCYDASGLHHKSFISHPKYCK